MEGLFYDFELNDIVIKDDGTFATAEIDSQNCALISLSEVCRLTKPEVGVRLGARIINRREEDVLNVVAEAKRAVEADGGTDVFISVKGDLQFEAKYK